MIRRLGIVIMWAVIILAIPLFLAFACILVVAIAIWHIINYIIFGDKKNNFSRH